MIRGLFERRVPQVLAVYLGASWGLVQFVDFLVSRYALSPSWTDLTLLGLALLIPSVLIFTYNHGKPGKDTIQRSDKVVIPLNVVVVAAVLFLVFRNRDLGAVVTTVTTLDEAGQTVERTVPRASFRRRVAVFDFDGPADDTATAWLRYGLPIGLLTDLSQNMFIDTRPGPAFLGRMRQLGYQNTVGLPLTLKRSLAAEHHLPYYTEARISRNGEDIAVDFSLYEVARAEPVQRRTYVDRDVFQLIDRISADLRSDLLIPPSAESMDLPVSEVMTSSLPAFRHMSEAAMTALIQNDWPPAIAQMQRAVEIDPTFAAAWLTLHNFTLVVGGQNAMEQLQKAMDHLYRLPERAQFDVKAQYYFLRQEQDKTLAIARMRVDLYPDDLAGWRLMSQLQGLRRDNDGLIASYQKMLELDPMQLELLRSIGGVYETKGDYASALRYYTQYAERFPDRPESFESMGSAYRLEGDLTQARIQLEKALLLADRNVEIITSLSVLDRDQGNFDTALRALEDALAGARTPQDRARVLRGLSDFHAYRGQVRRSLEYTKSALREQAGFDLPINVALSQLLALDEWVRAGQTAEARRLLAETSRGVSARFSVFSAVAALSMALESADTAEAARLLPEAERSVQQAGFQILEPRLVFSRGRLSELRGDCDAAVAEYEKYQTLTPTSAQAHTLIGRCLRQLGQASAAIERFQRALRVQPFHAPTNYEMALACLDAGDRTRAREHLERAASVWSDADPGYARAAEVKARLSELQRSN